MSDYTNHLFHYMPGERIATLSCGHVIPKSNLLAQPVSKGRNGNEFDFTFGKRNSESMVRARTRHYSVCAKHTDAKDQIRELGDAILEFARVVPDGLVVFFPSYAYLDNAIHHWQTPITREKKTSSLWTLLGGQKRIFLEPRSSTPGPTHSSTAPPPTRENDHKQSHAQSTDSVLAAYTAHVNSGNGALLFAVIGGSLSEGINFSDRLGRGIAVVGLPFPNPHSPEWKAKLEYVKQRSRTTAVSGGQKEVSQILQKDAAKDFYENACMRAVNQSVGRAIRHKEDYATILLLDRRYERESIKNKLPGWIRESLAKSSGFEEAVRGIKGFFEAKR